MKRQKSEIITFKVDEALLTAMQAIPNRSDFIRRAVVTALEVTCPLCQGTGMMSTEQKQHWDTFAADHQIVECSDCHEMHLVCKKRRSGRPRR